jgi:hypothetical protein
MGIQFKSLQLILLVLQVAIVVAIISGGLEGGGEVMLKPVFQLKFSNLLSPDTRFPVNLFMMQNMQRHC